MLLRNGRPAISLIVPVHEEAPLLPELLATLEPFVGLHEIVVVDGGSKDGTYEALVERGVGQILQTPAAGRAHQMNFGARHATGHVLLFLHADTSIDHEGPELALRALDRGADAGCFQVRIKSAHRRLSVAGHLQSLRSRVLSSATGDQCLFVRSSVFEALGGFCEAHPICEDIDFVRRLVRTRGREHFVCLDKPVTTSGRRWERGGVNRTIALMWALRVAYHLGAPPERLAYYYRTVR